MMGVMAARRSRKATGKATGPRPRIDWVAAMAFYIGLGGTRSWQEVATEFNVSVTAVRKHAIPERWDERAAIVDERQAKRAIAQAEHTLERTRTVGLRVAAKLIDKIEQAKIDDVKPSDLAALVKTEMLLHGQATDVIGVAEAADAQRTVLQLVKPFVPEEQWPAVLDALEKTMGEAA